MAGISAADAAVSVRRLPPATTRASERPRWEVAYGSEATGWTVIGWVEEHHLRGARNPFYFATGIHPTTHTLYRLEGNTDFEERVNVIADFHLDPMTSSQHLGRDATR
jgi:hypothetical protein